MKFETYQRIMFLSNYHKITFPRYVFRIYVIGKPSFGITKPIFPLKSNKLDIEHLTCQRMIIFLLRMHRNYLIKDTLDINSFSNVSRLFECLERLDDDDNN